MYDFHKDKKRYYDMQYENAAKNVIPFINEYYEIKPGMNVLEVGCAEGGVLKAFIDKGCVGVGVELEDARLEYAREFNKEDIAEGKMTFINKNIYDPTLIRSYPHAFDIIVLKDVIEHIPDQEKIMAQFKDYLKEKGVIFFGFPPFNMPYGGHQQVSNNKLFSKIPYTHLLPMGLYKRILQPDERDTFVEIKNTGISSARFEKICKKLGYTILTEKFFLLNPIYEYKFGWKPKIQYNTIKAIPHLRDFVTTCVFYLIQK